MKLKLSPPPTRLPNCWEFQRCGREPGGVRADDLGVCPAALDYRVDGVNGGTNGGRTCWTIAGTCGPRRIECLHADQRHPCPECGFFQLVNENKTTKREGMLVELPHTPAGIPLDDRNVAQKTEDHKPSPNERLFILQDS